MTACNLYKEWVRNSSERKKRIEWEWKGMQNQIPHTANALATELMWLVFFIILLVVIAIQMRGRSTLNQTALIAIGGFSIWWQEGYSNWGPYLLYSPDFHLIPWGSTWWTSPNKPWFLLVSYPTFYTIVFTIMLAVMRRVITRVPSVPPALATLVIAGPIFYFFNYYLDSKSVEGGAWRYYDVFGPAQQVGGAYEPLVWPMIPFAIWGVVMCILLLRRDDEGRPSFERLTRPERHAPGFRREGMRALAWIIVWNVTYWFLLIMPVNLMREFFGHPHPLVP
jgi:hypothetical protein